MPSGSYSWLKVSKEQDNSANPTYGVYSAKTAPVENTDFIWIRLDQNNAFTPRQVPARYVVRSADTFNRRVQTGSGRYAVAGTLNTLLTPAKAQFMLDMAGLFTGSTPADSWSYSFEFWDTQATHRYLGGKVKKLSLAGDAQSQLMRLSYDLILQQEVSSPPSLAAPTIANFEAAVPYIFQNSAGLLKLKNGVLTKYKSLSFTIDNVLAPTYDELPYPTACYWSGRDVDWGVNVQYLNTTLRGDFNTVAVQATNQVKFTHPNGTSSITFDLKSSNYITNVQDDLPLDNAAYQAGDVAVFYDRTATVDMSYAVVV